MGDKGRKRGPVFIPTHARIEREPPPTWKERAMQAIKQPGVISGAPRKNKAGRSKKKGFSTQKKN